MTSYQTNRRLMPAFALARKRAILAATAALAIGALGGCKTDRLLNASTPDVLTPAAFSTPVGADPLRYGAISDFTVAFDGTTDTYSSMSADITDEMIASDTFADRLDPNRRVSNEINASTEAVYRQLQTAHLDAVNAGPLLATIEPKNLTGRAEMYLIRGYTELMLAEGFCSGTPFSSVVNGATVYGQPNTTVQLFTMANASMDTALQIADSNRVKFAAMIGKGRALLNLGQFANAAAAVASVPRNFQYLLFHSTVSREQDGIWLAEANGSTRYSIIDKEGINGLPYMSINDPRVPWSPSTRAGFDALTTNLPTELKFTRISSSIVGDGTEAQLIILEARLQGAAQSDRDAVFAGLNSLRQTNVTAFIPGGTVPVLPVIAGSAPTTQAAAVDQFFAERAYWTWLTGHRLGDMRRLIRQYGRSAETVFPTGNVPPPHTGAYGPDVNFQIPFNERNNPNFKGCIDRNA